MKRLYVPGVFDVFHIGHLNYLKRASEAGDYVIVGVQDDRSVFQSKGVRPVIPLQERMAIIESLRFVDEVVSYIPVYQAPLLEGLKIGVIAVGEEYGTTDLYPDQRRTLDYCRANGIEVVRIPRTHHVSSTQIRERLKAFWNSRAQCRKELTSGVTVLGSFRGDQQKVTEETLREVALVLAASGDTRPKSLLDLGCGDGRHLVHLCPRFRRVVGVDFAASLIELARQRIAQTGASVELVEADAAEYVTPERFDVLLLSGIIPCLDDVQMDLMLSHLARMSKPDSTLLVRTSIGVDQRIDVVNQFSQELNSRYTAFYRTVPEIETSFQRVGWSTVRKEQLYQHREDTAVWWFEFNPASRSNGISELEQVPGRDGTSPPDSSAASLAARFAD